MLWREIVSLAAFAAALQVSAHACVPLKYDMSGVSGDVFAREMVEVARTVEVMRVVSRRAISTDRLDPLYSEYFGQVYAYRLETVSVLNGRQLGPLELAGLDEGWLGQRIPGAREFRHAPLWWLTERGYERLQETRFPNPADSGSLACATPMTFVVGAEYLVFRASSGDLIAPGFVSEGRGTHLPPQRPVVERLAGRRDPWLREVREAISENSKPGATFWESVFELVFGRR